MRVGKLWVTAILVGSIGCGGGGAGSVSSSPTPTPTPTPVPSSDPCATQAATSGEAASTQGTSEAAAAAKRLPHVDTDPRWSVLNSLWLHAASTGRLLLPLTEIDRHSQDIGDIAVVQDAGDIIVKANLFDLGSKNLRFARNGSAYDFTRIDTGFRTSLGTRLTLSDDDTSAFDIPFTFPFFGKGETKAFVNSDGNITFDESDTASTDRSVSRFLTGPPRVAPFFSDLDPSTGNGRVFLLTDATGATITWCTVRAFDSVTNVTVQAVLLPDGGVEFHYGTTVTVRNAVAGLSPGRTGQFAAVDLSTSPPVSSGSSAIGERFSSSADIDLVALARRFYQTHPDSFDQLVIFTDSSVVSGNTFAYESTVANEIRGLGVDIYDTSADFGSAGRLRSVVMMDALSKYPVSPTQQFLGENNTVSVMGQEVGHRWLAFLHFKDVNGKNSTALLGRDKAHWSFFMDTDASVMEGNDIQDLGGGSFKTVDAVKRYSLLDQYAMGLVALNQVPDFFYVEAPTNVEPSKEATDDPEIGVTFNGTRRDVKIQDVTSVMGDRIPAASASPRVHKQAFIYLLSASATLDATQVAKLDGIRKAWVAFFARATNNRMQAQTSLK
jgi:hypothetical protein